MRTRNIHSQPEEEKNSRQNTQNGESLFIADRIGGGAGFVQPVESRTPFVDLPPRFGMLADADFKGVGKIG